MTLTPYVSKSPVSVYSRKKWMPGSRCCTAKSAIRCWFVQVRTPPRIRNAFRAASGHRGEGALDVVGDADICEQDCHEKLARCRFDRRRLGSGAADMTENTHAGKLGDSLFQDFQLLGDELRARSYAHAGDVPARPAETADDRVGGIRHDDRYGRGGMFLYL
jgi:hypothetical protein